MEFAYRQVEYLIEGNHSKQRKFDNQPWNFEKVWKKTLKHLVFLLISFLSITTFLNYLIGVDSAREFFRNGFSAHVAGYIGLFVFTLLHYLVFAKFREQVCIIVCPYGRLQGVLLDKNTINITYDYKRGEPRGKHNPLAPKTESRGDCIDCSSCTLVCPTGIDIRNGTQLECINCAWSGSTSPRG
jgi:cytochrome c oxidase accessory protein FixG